MCFLSGISHPAPERIACTYRPNPYACRTLISQMSHSEFLGLVCTHLYHGDKGVASEEMESCLERVRQQVLLGGVVRAWKGWCKRRHLCLGLTTSMSRATEASLPTHHSVWFSRIAWALGSHSREASAPHHGMQLSHTRATSMQAEVHARYVLHTSQMPTSSSCVCRPARVRPLRGGLFHLVGAGSDNIHIFAILLAQFHVLIC